MPSEPDCPDLSDREIKLIRRSFALLARRHGLIANLVFDRLFELDPSLRLLFPEDRPTLNRKLMEMVALVVRHLDQPAALALVARQIRQRTNAKILLNHHAVFGQSFLWALRYGLMTHYNDDVGRAWTRLYARLVALALERPALAGYGCRGRGS
jgi:hemoglobin-like flavoprotein